MESDPTKLGTMKLMGTFGGSGPAARVRGNSDRNLRIHLENAVV